MAQTEGGVSGPVRRLGASLLALGRVRLELLAIEVQEEKERVASLLLWSALTAFAVGFGALFVALVITVAFWDTHRMVALGVAAALFFGLAVLAALRVQRLTASGSMMLRSSIDELRQDAAALRQGPTP
jgi:uncharacterized membrane protein YqjE